MSNALHRLQIRLVFAAIFALGVAQLGGVAHGYSHDAAAQARASHPTGAGTHEACNDCIAYAAVLSAAGTPSDSLCIAPAAPGLTKTFGCDSLLDDFLLLAFRSRAPPAAR